jgi:antirestriction protein ArdC
MSSVTGPAPNHALIASWETDSDRPNTPLEELIAELTSAFLCAELQFSLQPRPDHAHYIANWLKPLKSDKRAVFTAAARAAEAAAFIQAKPSS